MQQVSRNKKTRNQQKVDSLKSCGWWDSNPHALGAPDFESGSSANSDTSANIFCGKYLSHVLYDT